VLGWQCLYEALTGLRTEECLSLQMDARPDEPGGITSDGSSLCVRRADKARNENPYVEARLAVKQLLKAHRSWHQARYPNSPWYFPGRDGRSAVYKCALTKALDRLFRKKLLNKKFTSHGFRAFYVLIRRSQGASDTQIAVELNQLGGVKTLEDVYGKSPPHWLNGKARRLSWFPKGKPSWTKIKPATKA
jgi:integrase